MFKRTNTAIQNNTDHRKIVLLFMIGFALRCICLPFAQVVDADAVSRVFMAQEWWGNPAFIIEGVWPPFHQYLYGILIGISGDRAYVPIIFTMVLSALLSWPVYSIVKREISEKGAFWTALAISLSPVLFRNSFHTLSGTVFLLAIAFGWNSFSKALKDNSTKHAIYTGIWFTLAAGFRYEGWLLIALFTGIGVISKQWKLVSVYWLTAMIFPIFWMLGNYSVHNDFFFGLSGAYEWNIILEGVNDLVPRDVELLRLLFFPSSWFFLFSPLLLIALSIALYRRWKSKEWRWSSLRWGLIFFVFMLVFIYKSFEGTLLTQHRFTGTLLLFSIPFVGLIWEVERAKWLRLIAKILILSMVPLSYVWMRIPYESVVKSGTSTYYALENFRKISYSSLPAVPRLTRKNLGEVKKNLNQHLNSDDGLVLDFISWETTYNIALHSNVSRENMFIFNGAKNAENYFGLLEPIFISHNSGCLLIRKNGGLNKMVKIENNQLTLRNASEILMDVELIGSYDDFCIYYYRMVRTEKPS